MAKADHHPPPLKTVDLDHLINYFRSLTTFKNPDQNPSLRCPDKPPMRILLDITPVLPSSF